MRSASQEAGSGARDHYDPTAEFLEDLVEHADSDKKGSAV
jgi:hypothetical protein